MTAGVVAAVAGAIDCVVGARAVWASGAPQIITIPGTNGFQSVNLHAGGGSTLSGASFGAGVAAFFVVVAAVCVLLGELSSGGRRQALIVAGVVVASIGLGFVARASLGIGGRAVRTGLREVDVHGAAVGFSLAGAAVALAGAAVAERAAHAAPSVRLPEAPPESEEAFDE